MSTGRRGNVRALLGSRAFRRLLAVRLISQFGDGLFQAALAGSLLFNPQQRTGPLEVAVGFAVLLLPYSLVGPYVGVFLDRWSRRTVLFVANLLRAGIVVPTALLIWLGREQVPFVMCALLIIGINRFFLSGLSAAQPHVVPADRLVTANAMSGTLGTLVYSLGLGTTALVLNTLLNKDFHGYAVLACAAAIGYVASALLARFSYGRPDLGPDDTERHPGTLAGQIVEVARGMVAGARHLGGRPVAWYAVSVQSAHRALYGVLTMATLLLYRHYFYGGDSTRALAGLAQVVVAGGFGSLLAAFVTPPMTRRIGGRRYVALLLCGAGLLVLALGLPFRPELLVVATFVVNVASGGTKIVVDTALQRECDDDYRGRVFSVNDTLFNVCLVIGLFVGALTLPVNGHSPTGIALVSLGYLAVAGWYAATSAGDGTRPRQRVAVGSINR